MLHHALLIPCIVNTRPSVSIEATPPQVVSKRDKIILMCAIGGTLDTNVSYRREKKIYADPERAFGRESRSLKAAFELYEVRRIAATAVLTLLCPLIGTCLSCFRKFMCNVANK